MFTVIAVGIGLVAVDLHLRRQDRTVGAVIGNNRIAPSYVPLT